MMLVSGQGTALEVAVPSLVGLSPVQCEVYD